MSPVLPPPLGPGPFDGYGTVELKRQMAISARLDRSGREVIDAAVVLHDKERDL